MSSVGSSYGLRQQQRSDPYKRNSLACNTCRRRKQKCLGGQPCPTCEQRGLKCVYVLTDRKILVSERYLNELETRIRPQRVHAAARPASQALPRSGSTDESVVDESWLDDLQDLKISDSSSTSFGQRIFDFARPASSVNHEDSRQPQTYEGTPWPRRSSVSILPQLPPVNFAQRLFSVQHTYIGTIFSFLRPDDFRTRLNWVYLQNTDFDDIEDRLIYAQILMVFAYGTTYSVNQWTGNEGPPGFNYFIQALEFLPELHEEGSILFVEVLGLVGYYMQNLNRRDAAFLYIGVALRMAISLGLHQEVTDPEIDVVEREHRRRVWWSVYSMDRIICIKSGNPITIADADISVNMPSQLPGVESDKYVATVLSCYTHLSKILGKIMEGVYRKAHNSGPNLMLAVQNIMSELSTWFRKLPQQIQSDYNNLEGPIPRESVSIFLHYHQCINMVARPLMFHIIRKRLRDHHDTTQDWRLGLAPEAVQVIEKCITSARGTIQMMTEAFKQNLVAVYGFMDQEHAFSAALVLVMTNLAFPPSEDNVTASDAALALLRSIADRGNTHVDKRLSMLQELKVGPADNRASTSNDTHHPTTTNMTSIIYSQTTAPLGGPAEPTAILMQPSTSFGEDMSFGVDDPSFGLTGPDELRMWEEASGNLGATMDFDWIEEALRESAHE